MNHKLIPFILLSCSLLTAAIAQDASLGNPPAANPADLKFGLYVHYGIPTFARPGDQGQLPAERFAPPAPPDVQSWARAAKAAGMTFAVLTAKHESGFCLWDSPGYGYGVAQSPYKGDLIGDFIAACNAEGILPGVHYSIPDSFNEGKARGRGPVSPVYFAVIKKHLTELHTRYPGIRIQKIDAVWRLSPDQFLEIRNLIKRLNPGCVLLDNSKQPTRGQGCYDDSIIKGWMWKSPAQLSSADTLFDHYSWAREAGHAYVLNVGPDPSGHIPEDQMAILMQLKEMIATRQLTPPPAAPAAAQPATPPSAADRLKQLKSLYDQGLINKDEYDRKTKEILDSL